MARSGGDLHSDKSTDMFGTGFARTGARTLNVMLFLLGGALLAYS
jgi:hypothetical protein